MLFRSTFYKTINEPDPENPGRNRVIHSATKEEIREWNLLYRSWKDAWNAGRTLRRIVNVPDSEENEASTVVYVVSIIAFRMLVAWRRFLNFPPLYRWAQKVSNARSEHWWNRLEMIDGVYTGKELFSIKERNCTFAAAVTAGHFGESATKVLHIERDFYAREGNAFIFAFSMIVEIVLSWFFLVFTDGMHLPLREEELRILQIVEDVENDQSATLYGTR